MAKASKVVDFETATKLVPNVATADIASSAGILLPDRMLAALRFAATGEPRGLTAILPIAAGDRFGQRGIDALAQPGMLARIIVGSYPSGPSSAAPPAIVTLIASTRSKPTTSPPACCSSSIASSPASAPGCSPRSASARSSIHASVVGG